MANELKGNWGTEALGRQKIEKLTKTKVQIRDRIERKKNTDNDQKKAFLS